MQYPCRNQVGGLDKVVSAIEGVKIYKNIGGKTGGKAAEILAAKGD